jgi:hypothetical protein
MLALRGEGILRLREPIRARCAQDGKFWLNANGEVLVAILCFLTFTGIPRLCIGCAT